MSKKAIKILIVDDERVIRKSLRAFFEDYGYDVTDVESAEDALKVIQEEEFNLGIIDLRLPGKSGDDFILEANKIKPDIKFLIHTGSVDFNITEELEKTGMTKKDIILKPLPSLIMLIDKIHELYPGDQ